jgi:hypothetical protein
MATVVVAEVRPPTVVDAVRVYVPVAPVISHPAKVAAPPDEVTGLVVHDNVAPLDGCTVIVSVTG